ncbi:DUF262 domain-containing protein [Treponema parvum]|uniref:DUF262 domain-containing protein n=1 Tax=Treponema parvum TaxID=138851 RepID=A0A975IE35_9SPIR|nr:DUF262 domain-containing protein [Treponema parvum]QTQ13531.1 DUF262 domain-containing protein [Treponema parvum]
MSDIYTFYKLISKYKIQIPVIQREYAQGRKDVRAHDIRKSFIASLIECTKSSGKTLFLDFTYGKMSEDKIFIPFDGQQRLTTLFLFHLFVFKKTGFPEVNRLLDFSYKTRLSSKEFCEAIVKNNIIPKTGDISSFIKDQSWYFAEWTCDATVEGMLVVLDEIQRQIDSDASVDCNFIKDSLLSDDCITFHFVDMGVNKLPDETYIKMNARGKSLTSFENFKASLEDYLETKDDKLYHRFKGEYIKEKGIYSGIDGQWMEFFFNKNNQEIPDSLIQSIMNRHFINAWNIWYSENAKTKSELKRLSNEERLFQDAVVRLKSQIDTDFLLYPTDENFISWDLYKNIFDNCTLKNTVEPIFNFFDALLINYENIINTCKTSWEEKENWNPLQGKKDKDTQETYKSRVAFYAMVLFFNRNYEIKQLKEWMRIIWNYLENTTIDSEMPYNAALRVVKALSVFSNSIIDGLADHYGDINLPNDFAGKIQVSEEKLKAEKILSRNGRDWKTRIIEAEGFALLKGKINVLFIHGEKTTYKDFSDRLDLLIKIYENNDEYHFVKVLLSYYEDKSLTKRLALKRTDNNWKRLLTEDLFKTFQLIESDKIKRSKIPWINDLCSTDLLNNSREDGKIVTKYGDSFVLWGTSGCVTQTYGNPVRGNVVIGHIRNKLLTNEKIKTDSKLKNVNFYEGINIDFEYKSRYFQWWRRNNDNEAEFDVYLMLTSDPYSYAERNKKPKTLTNTDLDKYFCFNITKEMKTDSEIFIKALGNLITEYNKDRK